MSFKRVRRVIAVLARGGLVASLAASLLLTSCASLPDRVDRPVSTALSDNSDTMLGRTVAARAAIAIQGIRIHLRRSTSKQDGLMQQNRLGL